MLNLGKTTKIVALLTISYGLASCGGGGSSAPSLQTDNSIHGSQTKTPIVVETQHQYLPLRSGDRLTYNASNLTNWKLHPYESVATKLGDNRFKLSYEVIDQILETQRDEVKLLALQGDFLIDLGSNNKLQVTRVEFATPIKLLAEGDSFDKAQAITNQVRVYGKLNGGQEKAYPFSLQGTRTLTKGTFGSTTTYDTLKSALEYELRYTKLGINIAVIDNTSFIKNVGVVEKNMSVKYENETLQQFVMNLQKLP